MNKPEPILDVALPVAIVTFLVGSFVMMLWRLFA